jgi:hypothetical protein
MDAGLHAWPLGIPAPQRASPVPGALAPPEAFLPDLAAMSRLVRRLATRLLLGRPDPLRAFGRRAGPAAAAIPVPVRASGPRDPRGAGRRP